MLVVRSPHANARISAMDLAAAHAVPGVRLILTPDDPVDIPAKGLAERSMG